MNGAMTIMLGQNNAGFQGKIYTCPFVQILNLTPAGMAQSREFH